MTPLSPPTRPPPNGVATRSLTYFSDSRGSLAEVFRETWGLSTSPAQININHSGAGVLRGMRAHFQHTDYLAVVAGHMTLGLRDARRRSPTFGATCCLELSSQNGPQVVILPPGVIHGMYFPEASTHLYCASHEFNVEDELSCRWDDPALEIPWVLKSPIVSTKDAAQPSLMELMHALAQHGL
ncbi:MAG: dTDP-4-dehydrorhamnose 3,5-epimerase family protein [Myxococcaceae bacterium]